MILYKAEPMKKAAVETNSLIREQLVRNLPASGQSKLNSYDNNSIIAICNAM